MAVGEVRANQPLQSSLRAAAAMAALQASTERLAPRRQEDPDTRSGLI